MIVVTYAENGQPKNIQILDQISLEENKELKFQGLSIPEWITSKEEIEEHIKLLNQLKDQLYN